jgi:GxxExxY protein
LLEHEAITEAIIGCAIKVHRGTGPGCLESVYEICLAHELAKLGLSVARQVDVPIIYDGVRLDAGFRIDLLVASCVVVEIKAVEKIHPIHEAQLMTYLRLAGHRVGLLINFNVTVLKSGVLRRVL